MGATFTIAPLLSWVPGPTIERFPFFRAKTLGLAPKVPNSYSATTGLLSQDTYVRNLVSIIAS
jgi:hypothetical protein